MSVAAQTGREKVMDFTRRFWADYAKRFKTCLRSYKQSWLVTVRCPSYVLQ